MVASNTEETAPNSGHVASASMHESFSIDHIPFTTGHATFTTGHATSTIDPSTSNIDYTPSHIIGHATSIIGHATSVIDHATSVIDHAASTIVHVTSDISHAASNIEGSASKLGNVLSETGHAASNYGHATSTANYVASDTGLHPSSSRDQSDHTENRSTKRKFHVNEPVGLSAQDINKNKNTPLEANRLDPEKVSAHNNAPTKIFCNVSKDLIPTQTPPVSTSSQYVIAPQHVWPNQLSPYLESMPFYNPPGYPCVAYPATVMLPMPLYPLHNSDTLIPNTQSHTDGSTITPHHNVLDQSGRSMMSSHRAPRMFPNPEYDKPFETDNMTQRKTASMNVERDLTLPTFSMASHTIRPLPKPTTSMEGYAMTTTGPCLPTSTHSFPGTSSSVSEEATKYLPVSDPSSKKDGELIAKLSEKTNGNSIITMGISKITFTYKLP